jgi:hypothetical protein
MRRFFAWFFRKFTWLRCCKCGRHTAKVTHVCERCGHRFCEVCRGEPKRGKSA